MDAYKEMIIDESMSFIKNRYGLSESVEELKAEFNRLVSDAYYFEEVPIVMEVEAYMPVPTKFRKAEKLDALAGKLKPCEKPDVDNILKAILDALNAVAYADDRFIYKLSIVREYSENPRTVVRISDEINI